MQILSYRNISFPKLLGIQEECLLKVSTDKQSAFLIVSEPAPTFTSGISAKNRDLLWKETTLKEKGIEIVPVARGGKWTYHGPGQIVVFPIVPLEKLGLTSKDTKAYVEILTKSVQDWLYTLGLTSSIKDTPYGIYIGENKICSFGIKIEKGITTHGLALYLSAQKEAFKGINPCGQENAKLTSLWEEGCKLTWEDASNQMVNSIKKSFKLL